MILKKVPLKDMDAALLVLAIQQEAKTDDLQYAMELAAYVHRNKRRANPTRSSDGTIHQPSSPYIVHPLRNTLRLIRWGVTDKDILIASILHDTVEDHARELAQLSYPNHSPMTEAESRIQALEYIYDSFGRKVYYIVKAVTNMIPDKKVSKEDRMAGYVEHVAVSLDAIGPFLVKFSDFCDNALGLHHQEDNLEMVQYLARKYSPLVPHFQAAATRHHNYLSTLSQDFWDKLEKADGYLRERVRLV